MTEVKKYGTEDIIINDIQLVAVNRTKKSIADWRSALRAAESIQFPNRTRLYDLYEDIVLDGHLTGIIAKRIDAVLNKSLHYTDATGRKVDGMDAYIHSAAFRAITWLIMETQLWGVSGIEFLPGSELAFERIPRKHIKPEVGIISMEQNALEGIPYAGIDNIWVIGEQHDLGLLLQCTPLAIYKRDAMADWANYIEVFGQPVRIIKYDAYDEQTKIELKKILDEAGSSLSIMIPHQAEFDMKDGKQANASGDLQAQFIRAMDEGMSIVILGNTETTTNGKTGSQAKSIVHALQQDEIAKSDLVYVANALNDPRLHRIVRSYGWPVMEGGRFAFTRELDINFLERRIAVDKEAAAMGTPITIRYMQDTYGYHQPEEGQQLLPHQTQTARSAQSPTRGTLRKPGSAQPLQAQNIRRLRSVVKAWKYFFG